MHRPLGHNMDSETFDVVLRDGRRVRVSPIRPEDKKDLQAGLARLSPESKYYRFNRVITELSREALAFLTEVDHYDHVALGVRALDEPGNPGVAVARFVRHVDDPGQADVGITVVDDYHGVGLGTILLETLIAAAARRGIQRLVGSIAPENEAARRLFRRSGGTDERWDYDVVISEIEISGPLRSWRSSSAIEARKVG